MALNISIKIKNYKCFSIVPQGFNKIYPINIIVGKNNSGKSSLIDLISYVVEPEKDLIKTKWDSSQCIISVVISEEFIQKVAEQYSLMQDATPSPNWFKNVKQQVGDSLNERIDFIYDAKRECNIIETPVNFGQFSDALRSVLRGLFYNKNFKRINAERDIKPETFYSKQELNDDGIGATRIIWKYLSIKNFDQDLIKGEFLKCLNEVINPDIEFVDIVIKEDDLENRQSANGEIYFKTNYGTWVSLSNMGSGLKTIILVLLNLIVIPPHKATNKKDYIFAFEELENNLHPSLQRRLFSYLARYVEKEKCLLFITTHSNILIDLFSANKDAQILHIIKDGDCSFVTTLVDRFEGRKVLKDLDYRASDILLSNGVVWVEGPSDAIYLELLLDLYKAKVKYSKPLNYCIQSLSTAIWKYAGFVDFDWDDINQDVGIENKLISLAKINHNHLIIIDRDNDYEDLNPSEWNNFKNGNGKNKARLIFESMKFSNQKESLLSTNYGDTSDGKLFFWINEGTFETYLEYFILDKGKNFDKYFEKNEKLGYFEKKRAGENSSKAKVELAAEIAKFTLKNELTLDEFAPINSPLLNKIERLLKTIESWN